MTRSTFFVGGKRREGCGRKTPLGDSLERTGFALALLHMGYRSVGGLTAIDPVLLAGKSLGCRVEPGAESLRQECC